MAAPRGNQFWKLRSKHGRDKLFATPALLWEAACEFFEWCDRHPWKKKEALKSGPNPGKLINVPIARPYTLSGLCLYLCCNEAYFRNFKAQLPEDDKDFSAVIADIEQTLFTQKFEGASVGAFNANIISRDLGLVDKKELGGNLQVNWNEQKTYQTKADE